MRHVFIYGPPGAGKLTVARRFADAYGFALLDNHLSFDVALRVFDFGTAEFNDLVERLRCVLFEATTAAGRDVVSTFVFGHPGDRGYVDQVATASEAAGADLCRVQLCPSPSVLEARVAASDRQNTNKIRDVETLNRVLADYDLYTPIDNDDLQIDNTSAAPDEVVATIAAHFGL